MFVETTDKCAHKTNRTFWLHSCYIDGLRMALEGSMCYIRTLKG